MMTNKIMNVSTAQDARKNFSEIISKATFANEPTIITRSGKSVAAVISFDDYEFFRELEDKLDGELATARLKKKGKRLSLEEVEAKYGL